METDLKERFSLADEVEAPNVWTEAVRRAGSIHPSRALPTDEPVSPVRRYVSAALAFAVFAAAALFAWEAFHGGVHTRSRPVDQPVDLRDELGPGWTQLPPPPEVRRRAAIAWTGSQLLMWGGSVFDGNGDETPAADGFVFDAATKSWHAMPPGPLSARTHAASAWTGRELLVWGGYTGDCCTPSEMFLDDGAAFDPSTDSWRSLPPPPVQARAPFSVWTGKELIVWGSGDRTLRLRDGAAYDPSTDSWRRLADAPTDITDGSAVWTGGEMVVFGAALDDRNHADTQTAIGIAYDPVTDTWRELPPSDLSPQAMTASWLDGAMIAWDYDHATASYDPQTDAWTALPRVPLEFAECRPESAAIRGFVFGNYCGDLALFATSDAVWRDITRGDLRDWVVEPVAAGDVFLILARSLELSGTPNRTFDGKMFAYAPPTIPEPTGVASFVPDSQAAGDVVRMPVVFPDGTGATVVYAGSLDLAGLGVRPAVSYLWKDDPPPRFPFVFLHAPNDSLDRYVRGDGPARLINTSDGGIEVWRARGNDVERRFWLRYELPSWTVLVSVRDALASAVEVNASLELSESPSGFPVAKTSGPIQLSRESGEGEGSMLEIGSTLDPSIFLWLERCSGPSEVDPSGGYGSMCLADGRVTANIYGKPADVQAIVEGLQVKELASTS